MKAKLGFIKSGNSNRALIIRIFFIVVICTFFSTSILAQGFPWQIFKPRTVKEVQTITTKAFRPDDSSYLATNLLESYAEVMFTGKSRPIEPSRTDFIKIWAGMLGHDKTYPDVYKREYLYKEGDDEYWLPTQEPVTKYFAKELATALKSSKIVVEDKIIDDAKSTKDTDRPDPVLNYARDSE